VAMPLRLIGSSLPFAFGARDLLDLTWEELAPIASVSRSLFGLSRGRQDLHCASGNRIVLVFERDRVVMLGPDRLGSGVRLVTADLSRQL
jgi:hypothetical protein